MRITRRAFLQASGLFVSTAWTERILASPFFLLDSPSPLPILQTFTNESTAQFRVLIETNQTYAYRVIDSHGIQHPIEILDRYIHPAWPDQGVDHLIAQNLKIKTEYLLQVLDGSTGKILDERFFSSLDRSKTVSRTAIISCLCDDFPDVQQKMWQVVADQNPDVIFLIGDETYLDGRNSDDEKGMWRRHLEVRKALDLYRWKRLRPVLSVWDDHDFGINDGGSDFPLKEATRKMFEAMYGSQAQSGLIRGPSLALEASFFGQRFYLMDDRFYRTKNKPKGSHWGEEQEEWLFSRLQLNHSPAFLMNGSQYFGAYSGYESFELEHPDQFQRVQKRLSQQQAPVVFASGDRHFSEVMRIENKILGYETYELTSSSLHSYRPDGVPSAVNPRRILASAEFNFILVESSAQGANWNLHSKCLGLGGRTLFSHSKQIHRQV